MHDLIVSLLQDELDWADPEANRARFGRRIAEAEPADLVVLPEMFTTGFTMTPDRHAEPAGGPTLDWMREQAAATGAVITGSVSVSDGGKYYNRLYWVTPGAEVGSYDKAHLFAMAGEQKQYSPGRRRLTVEVAGWRIRPVICYDLRFPVWCRNDDDYDALLVIANWPAPRRAHWLKLLQARAIENQAYVIAVNRVGEDDNGMRYTGDTLLIDPMGETELQATRFKGAYHATLSAEVLQHTRDKLPFLRDRDSFQIDG